MTRTRIEGEFYVGYLPVPAGLRRFLRRAVPVVLLMIAGAAMALGLSQRDPGAARWDQSGDTSFTGTLLARPYPVLFADSGGAIALVEQGKHGARARAEPLDGRRVRATGRVLSRDGRSLLELLPGEKGLVAIEGAPEVPAESALGTRTLRGEIIDPKCAFGAMKPGTGRTHKECAILCIRGGIPPMLRAVRPDGRPEYYLLSGPDGGPIEEWLVPFVGDEVEVVGGASARGPLLILEPRRDGVTRR